MGMREQYSEGAVCKVCGKAEDDQRKERITHDWSISGLNEGRAR